MLQKIERDCRSTTGRNIRMLQLQLEKTMQDDLFKTPYARVPEGEQCKISNHQRIDQSQNGKHEYLHDDKRRNQRYHRTAMLFVELANQTICKPIMY